MADTQTPASASEKLQQNEASKSTTATVSTNVGSTVQQDQNTLVASAAESDEKFFAALGYFAFLFVIPLIVKPKSAYCKFHARQSMVMFLGSIVVLFILGLVPWFGSLLTLAIFALYVLAIYKAYNGDMWAIPVVSQLASKMNVDSLYGKAGLAVTSISGMKEKAAQIANQAGSAMKDLGNQEKDKEAPQASQEATPSALPVIEPKIAAVTQAPAPTNAANTNTVAQK